MHIRVWWLEKGNVAFKQNKRGKSIKMKVIEAFSSHVEHWERCCRKESMLWLRGASHSVETRHPQMSSQRK